MFDKNGKIIYRYMSYCEFLDILKQKRLTLKYPGKWPDNLEMLFLKQFNNQMEIDNLIKEYENAYPEFSKYDIKSDLQILTSLLMRTRCQCWTYKEDDLIMWNERNSDETVRIGVNKESFNKCKSIEYYGNLSHSDVNYVQEVTVKSIMQSFHKGNRKYTTFVIDKKDVFSYEKEHRIILSPNDYFFSTQSYGNTLAEFLERHFCGIKSEFGTDDKHITFDIRDIIDVKVTPYATSQFTNSVEQDCNQFKLKFNGISKILM